MWLAPLCLTTHLQIFPISLVMFIPRRHTHSVYNWGNLTDFMQLPLEPQKTYNFIQQCSGSPQDRLWHVKSVEIPINGTCLRQKKVKITRHYTMKRSTRSSACWSSGFKVAIYCRWRAPWGSTTLTVSGPAPWPLLPNPPPSPARTFD